MRFLRNLFLSKKSGEEDLVSPEAENDSLDQVFVKNFVQRKGKFLYCTSLEEVVENIQHITSENDWKTLVCNDHNLLKLFDKTGLKISEHMTDSFPVFLSCEYLIAENGSILFSSNQLREHKIASLSDHFIVYATTSQLVKTKGESLTGIKSHYRGNIPSNISAVKNYELSPDSKDLMHVGNNAKNLYLLLFEDL